MLNDCWRVKAVDFNILKCLPQTHDLTPTHLTAAYHHQTIYMFCVIVDESV